MMMMLQEGHGAGEPLDIGSMVLHHTADAWTIELPFGLEWHLPRWHDVHFLGMTVNLSPTKHVVFMLLTAFLVFLTLKLAAGGEKRDDVPGIPSQWAFVMDAGLRFNLWAPPKPR